MRFSETTNLQLVQGPVHLSTLQKGQENMPKLSLDDKVLE